eukprot:COSAG05_NODE_300_length_11883_cov_12.913357_10_plen_249_part_00
MTLHVRMCVCAVTKEQLFADWSRRIGAEPPRARLVDHGGEITDPAHAHHVAGVYYEGGHPTWPLWTVNLDTYDALLVPPPPPPPPSPSPTAGRGASEEEEERGGAGPHDGDGSSSSGEQLYGYELVASIWGSFDDVNGRLSMILASAADPSGVGEEKQDGGEAAVVAEHEFYLTRNPLPPLPPPPGYSAGARAYGESTAHEQHMEQHRRQLQDSRSMGGVGDEKEEDGRRPGGRGGGGAAGHSFGELG